MVAPNSTARPKNTSAVTSAAAPEAPQAPGNSSAAGSPPSLPFHQGQLDVFCAVYAVINALRAVHPLAMGQARRLFNEVLLDLARDAEGLRAVLYNATDHDALVRAVLDRASRDVVALRVTRPFADAPALGVTGRVGPDASGGSHNGARAGAPCFRGHHGQHGPDATPQPTPRALWQALAGWLSGGPARGAVLRFHRYLPFRGDPVISHWTAAGRLLGETLFLHDSSRESNAIHQIEQSGFVTAPEHLSDDRLLLVEPRCLYLLEAGKD